MNKCGVPVLMGETTLAERERAELRLRPQKGEARSDPKVWATRHNSFH